MDKEELAGVKDIVFTRIRAIVSERYGEFIPPSLIEDYSGGDDSLRAIKGFESFKADVDLIELFEAFHKIVKENYGYCLLCRKDIDAAKLRANPVAKFCDECARILSPTYSTQELEHSHH